MIISNDFKYTFKILSIKSTVVIIALHQLISKVLIKHVEIKTIC